MKQTARRITLVSAGRHELLDAARNSASLCTMQNPDQADLHADIRSRLLRNLDIALLDVREEVPHAQGHPLFAASMPLGTIEQDAYTRLPRREVPIVVIDGGEGLAERAAATFRDIGYSDVRVYAGGTPSWAASGGQLFKDINVPSKSFGELVHARKHTPELSPEDVNALAKTGNVVILDVRRPDEYDTFSVPGGNSVPGGEVVLRLPALVPDDTIQVVVHCAGRTRGLLWSQSLINAGVRNPVAALRNGTIGWTSAGLPLVRAQQRSPHNEAHHGTFQPASAARSLADRARVKRAAWRDVEQWQGQHDKTTYFFDARSHQEYLTSHLPNWRIAPSGEIVQELMMYAPVRGARIVLVDDDGVRANMAASWLSQMNCDVWVLDDPPAFTARGDWQSPMPQAPQVDSVSAHELQSMLGPSAGAATGSDRVVVVDLARHADYEAAHIPGAWFALRSDLRGALTRIPHADRYVLTDSHGTATAFAAKELARIVGRPVSILNGGNSAWRAAGFASEQGPGKPASPAIDRFQRPYENPDSAADLSFDRRKIQEYIDWLSGSDLMQQLSADGTSGFWVL